MKDFVLSQQEVKKVVQRCTDPLVAFGLMKRPEHLQCFERKAYSRTLRHHITCESEKGASDWNSRHEKLLLRRGHIGTIALSGVLGCLKGGKIFLSMAAVLAGINKTESKPGRRWYPKMNIHWRLTRSYNLKYSLYPQQKLFMKWTDYIQDEKGKVTDRYAHNALSIDVGGAVGIPQKVVRDMMTNLPVINSTVLK